MNFQYPYQLVAFLDRTPDIGEPVYGGENGWYPQIALKRRFGISNITETQLVELISDYCARKLQFTINVLDYEKPERMPVGILRVEETQELTEFHRGFIAYCGSRILSKFPERDGQNYLPHITAEYEGKNVVDIEQYKNKSYVISNVWLLKDIESENSVAFKKFVLVG